MTNVSWTVSGPIIVAFVFLCLGLGMPVAVALGLVGIVSAYIFLGSFGIVGYVAWELSNSFILSAIPLFIFMGQVLLHSGVSHRLYDGSTALLGRTKGGLLQTNIMSCALFATISGSSVATAATIGAMAIPEMEKRGYDFRMTLGSLAAGGTLGILIPPSSAMIIYGVIAEQSIGELFIAGVIPGIIMALIFMSYIWIRVALRPDLAPQFEPMPRRERLTKIFSMWPIIVIMFIILAGIYLGIMTPSEAAAVGSVLALVFAAIFRRLTWTVLWESLRAAAISTSMLMFIIIGASILGGTMGLLRIPTSLASWVLSLNLSPTFVLLSIYLMYIILGCFIDTTSMIVLTLPFALPIILGLGYDPIWFGVIIVILVEMGLITPPVGLNVFTIHSLTRGRPLSDIFAGALPFLGLMMIAITLLTVFPKLSTWLPATMR